MKKENKDWVKPSEAAKTLGISRGTIYLIIQRKEIKSFTFGNCIRIAKKDLEEYIKRSENK